MFRSFYIVAFLSIPLTQTGCNEKTVPATFDPPIQETKSSESAAPALPLGPFAPRSSVKENIAKEEPVLPIPVPELSASFEKLQVTENPVPVDEVNKPVDPVDWQPAPETAKGSEIDPWEQNTLHSALSDKQKENNRTESPAVDAVKTEPAPPILVNDVFAQQLASTENSTQAPPTSSGFEEIKTDSKTSSETLSETPPEALSPFPVVEPSPVEEAVKPKETQMLVAPAVSTNPLRHPKEVFPETNVSLFDSGKAVQKTDAFAAPVENNNIVQKQETEIVPVENEKAEQKETAGFPVEGEKTVQNAEPDAVPLENEKIEPKQEVVLPFETEKTEQKPAVDVVPFTKEKTEQKPVVPAASPADEKKPFDPVAVNGELFVDWEKPKLLLVFTGFMNGYVEPCGCAGMEQMKGGLSRRHTFFKELEKRNWPVLAIDAGNLNKGFGRQEELKFNIVIDEALRLMKYQAAGIGDRELLLPTDALILYCVDVPGIPRRYTSVNIAVMEFDPDFTAPYRMFEQNGIKVGVTSVIAPSLLKNMNNDDIKQDDAVQRLKAILPKLKEEKCDKKVLTVFGSPDEIKQIIKSVSGQFDYVISSDTPAEPPFRPNWVDNTMLIEVGEKGKFAVAIGLYDDPNMPYRYQRIPFDSRFENSQSIVALMQYYQDQLKETGLQGLGIKPIPNRRAAENGQFVGSKSCADCHDASYSIWKKSKHAAAWRSLVETSKPSRTYDPECIACHVVGWNPAEFLPYEHGFRGEKETPQLLDVGCESCHGPGENHVKAEKGSDTTQQEKLRQAIRLPIEGNVAKKVCMQCHDGDNSPHFNFETYWQKIGHKEKE